MSEYQYVAFRAIDAPVSPKNLQFMNAQSSRAKITPWTFENEYNFGSLHGNAIEMLRRGYDFHLHFADFGVRTLMIRLPNGLPDAKLAEPYLDSESLEMLAEYQKSHVAPSWPTVRLDRTLAELNAAADEIQREMTRSRAKAAARQRASMLAAMAADPAPTITEAQELVKQRGSLSYEKLASLLADLREALAGTNRAALAEEQARTLVAANPTLKLLISKLKGKGFLKTT